MWGYDIAPGGTALSEFGACMCLTRKRSFVKVEEFETFRWSIEWLTSLSLYHDSQFSAFSAEVLAWPNRGTIAVVLLVLR